MSIFYNYIVFNQAQALLISLDTYSFYLIFMFWTWNAQYWNTICNIICYFYRWCALLLYTEVYCCTYYVMTCVDYILINNCYYFVVSFFIHHMIARIEAIIVKTTAIVWLYSKFTDWLLSKFPIASKLISTCKSTDTPRLC